MDCKICFGIPSYLPDEHTARLQRQEKINNLFIQLSKLWPEIDILVITQNWQDFKPEETKNNQIIKTYDKLGILGARKTLRTEFLKLDYDYIIMLDDDLTISCTEESASKFIEEISKHKDGFCFIPSKNNPKLPYIGTQLNLCAISRFIYENEPMVDIDPQKGEGYEDAVYACLLHYKWAAFEFIPPIDIKPVRWTTPDSKVISTWINDTNPVMQLQTNTNRIIEHIIKYKDFTADDKKDLCKIQKVIDTKKCYLYF